MSSSPKFLRGNAKTELGFLQLTKVNTEIPQSFMYKPTICGNVQTNYKTRVHKKHNNTKLECNMCVRIKAFCSSTARFLIPKRFMCTTLAQLHVITVGSSYQPAFKGGYARRVSISGFPAVTLSFHVLAKWHIHSLTSNNKFTVLEL